MNVCKITQKTIHSNQCDTKTSPLQALYPAGACTDCAVYHNACHIAADKIHGVVWFHHAIQPSLTCHCPDTGTGIGPHTSVRRKYQPSPTACALCPLQEPYTLSKVILNFSRIIIYAYTLTQHSAGVEQELLTTHTFCRQSSMSLISQSYSHEVVCSIVTSSGSD